MCILHSKTKMILCHIRSRSLGNPLLMMVAHGESFLDSWFFRLESLLRGDNIKFFSLNVPALVVCTENSSNCFM